MRTTRQCARLHAHARQFRSDWRTIGLAVADRRAALALSVAEYTRELRDAGVAPERVVVQLKQLCDNTCSCTSVSDARVLRDDIVSWAIEVYFAA